MIALKSGIRQGYPLSPHISILAIEDLGRAIKQLKEIKGIQNRKEEVKLLLFEYGSISKWPQKLYLGNPTADKHLQSYDGIQDWLKKNQ